MIRTPEARRRVIPKTKDGYKLRGAMIWVVAGVVSGIVAANIAMGLAIATSYLTRALIDGVAGVCPGHSTWVYLVDALGDTVLFAAVGALLFMLRKGVAALVRRNYGEFATDVGDWFAFGSLLAYVVSGVPLLLVSIFAVGC
jgi:hypothetical protein